MRIGELGSRLNETRERLLSQQATREEREKRKDRNEKNNKQQEDDFLGDDKGARRDNKNKGTRQSGLEGVKMYERAVGREKDREVVFYCTCDLEVS